MMPKGVEHSKITLIDQIDGVCENSDDAERR